MKIWVLLILHRHGQNTYLHLTEAGARKSLATFADEYWTQELGTRAKPRTPARLVDRYFELVEDESYTLEHVDVQD